MIDSMACPTIGVTPDGFSHLNIEGEMIALCFETFENDPAKYLRHRAARKISEDIHPSGSFSLFDP